MVLCQSQNLQRSLTDRWHRGWPNTGWYYLAQEMSRAYSMKVCTMVVFSVNRIWFCR